MDFVGRLKTEHAAGYRIGEYADPSDLVDHLLLIVPAVEVMFAIEIRLPCFLVWCRSVSILCGTWGSQSWWISQMLLSTKSSTL